MNTVCVFFNSSHNTCPITHHKTFTPIIPVFHIQPVPLIQNLPNHIAKLYSHNTRPIRQHVTVTQHLPNQTTCNIHTIPSNQTTCNIHTNLSNHITQNSHTKLQDGLNCYYNQDIFVYSLQRWKRLLPADLANTAIRTNFNQHKHNHKIHSHLLSTWRCFWWHICTIILWLTINCLFFFCIMNTKATGK